MRARLTVLGLALSVVTVAGLQDPTIVTNPPEPFSMRVLATGLDGPWEVTWGPDQQLWVTERRGKRIVRIDPVSGMRSPLVTVHEVHQSVGQDGLLGLALHPNLLRGGATTTDFVYVAFTYDDAAGAALRRRLAIRRYEYDSQARTLLRPLDVITGLPAHDDHVGGRLVIGRDLKLYLTIGDQGSNFGGNRCNSNHAQVLPTAAQIQKGTGPRTKARSCASTLMGPFRRITRRLKAFAAISSLTAIAIRSDLSLVPTVISTNQNMDPIPTMRST